MVELTALAALAADAAVGWPAVLYRRIGHPVGFFAMIIDGCERRWNVSTSRFAVRRVMGVATVLILLTVAGGGSWILQITSWRLFGKYTWICLALFAFPALAQRSLFVHVRSVADALAGGDVAAARQAVGMIVGRDTAVLEEAGIARAAIESLSESFCDGVAAPLFWLLVLGLPGVWAYKAINTADSLVGHREARWRAFGWAAARLDDALNLIPARLGGALICLAGGGGWRVMLRDARKHASPNAGWTEAAMAGALGLRLAGPMRYEGVMSDKLWVGDGRTDATAADIDRALAVYLRACACLWLIVGGIAWLR